MKKYIYPILFVLCFGLQSCEEVVDLDINQYEKRLVIDGNIFVNEQDGNKIKLYYSAPFYADKYEYIDNALVTITDIQSNNIYTYNYTQDGWYQNSNFNPVVGNTYKLNVKIGDIIYEATSTVTIAPEIEKVEQFDDAGFTGNQYEIRFYYQDDVNTEDYYIIQTSDGETTEYSFSNDQLTNGNLVYDINFADKEKKGETITFSLGKISKDYYNYINKLSSNTATQGNPFATPAGTLKGNIINLTNENDFALGYFHLAKRNTASHTIK